MSKRLTQEEFETKFYNKYPKEFKVIGVYKTALTPIDVQCTTCGEIITQTPNHFDKGTSKCPVCNKNGNTFKPVIGVYDMWTTHPNVAKWLSNPDDGYKYRFNTTVELDFICPCCGKHRIVRPNYLRNGYICCYCSDNITYPNKLMANVLDLCGIKFRTEFHFPNSKYRYDFYFIFNYKKYLVEMDGGFGHGNIDTTYATKEEQLIIDRKKDVLAIKNGCEIIRIDCNYDSIDNRFIMISNNILKSKLSKIIGITYDILQQCNTVTQQNYIEKFANYWQIGIRSYDQYMDLFHVNSRGVIRSYAKRAIESGMLKITYDDFLQQIRIASNHKLATTKGTPVLCQQTNKVFYGITEAQRKMHVSNLSNHLNGKKPYCGILPDGTKLTWIKLPKDEYKKYK